MVIVRGGKSGSRPVIPLRVGYLSYDFNEHPTAHLVEGLFIHHKANGSSSLSSSLPPPPAAALQQQRHRHQQSSRRVVPRFQALALSYGKNDNSTYRAAVEEHSHMFVNLVEKGHLESTEIIRRTGTHIVVDLQGHTLGSQPQITARRAAPIQVRGKDGILGRRVSYFGPLSLTLFDGLKMKIR